MADFTSDELRFLREAVAHLEFPSFLMKVTNLIGKPIEKGIEALPGPAKGLIESTSRRAIEGAFKAALSTLQSDKPPRAFKDAVREAEIAGSQHVAGSALSGFASGLFGLPALAIELPVTTGIILRSIANIAAEFGEDIESREAQLECLYIFSMGGPSPSDDEMESAYYTSRVGLARMVEKAMQFIAGKTAFQISRAVKQRSAPALVELIVRIASRFEIVVGEKAMGQLIPGIGAGAGALLNAAFSEHFNAVARYHFGLKRLEREHGKAKVEAEYGRIKQALMLKRAAR